MTLPAQTLIWLKENEWVETMNMEWVRVFENREFTIKFNNIRKRSETFLTCTRYQADDIRFMFVLPKEEQDFKTLMDILTK